MKQPDLSSWLTLEQVTKTLQISDRSVYRLRDEQKIRWATRRKEGERPAPVYHPDDVKTLKKSMSAPPPAKAPDLSPPALPAPSVKNGTHGKQVMKSAPVREPKALAAPASDSMGQLVALLSQRGALAPPPQPALFLTIEQAAEYSGLSPAYLRRACREGSIASLKDCGYKIRRSDLDAYEG